jgi:hypothetical protein
MPGVSSARPPRPDAAPHSEERFSVFEVVLVVLAFAMVFAFVQWWHGPDVPTS